MSEIILTGSMALAIGLLLYIFKYVPKMAQKRFDKKLGKLVNTFRVMNRIKDTTDIGWVVIWRSHNGNGSGRLYLSVEYEVYEPPFKSVRDEYQNLKLDNSATEMLHAMVSGDRYSGFTHSIQHGLVQKIMEENLATWAHFFPIGIDNEELYFCMIGTHREKTPFQNNKGMVITSSESALQHIWRRQNNSPVKLLKRNLYL